MHSNGAFLIQVLHLHKVVIHCNSSGSVTLTKYQAKYFYINEKASCGNVIGQGANNTSAEQEATGWFGIFHAGDTLLVSWLQVMEMMATYSGIQNHLSINFLMG